MKKLLGLGTLLWLAAMAGLAAGQTYPAKPIRIIQSYPAGASTDLVARVVSKEMQGPIGQPFIVEARVGAGGLIGVNAVKSADPDGYTIYFGVAAPFTSVFYKENPVDASKDFAPNSDAIWAPQFFFVNSKLNVNSIDELAAYAKSHPAGQLNHALSIGSQEIIMYPSRTDSDIRRHEAGDTALRVPALTENLLQLNVPWRRHGW